MKLIVGEVLAGIATLWVLAGVVFRWWTERQGRKLRARTQTGVV